MCIVVYKPAGKELSEQTLRICNQNNSDGAGFMYVEDDKLHVHKGFFTFEKFWEEYKEHQNKQAVLHFRIMTDGVKDRFNCHPFYVTDNMAVAHNGVLRDYRAEADATVSDTYNFVAQTLQPLATTYEDIAKDPVFLRLVQGEIGSGNKLVMLWSDTTYAIINEAAGQWTDGVWFSNRSYCHIPKPFKTGFTPAWPEKSRWGRGRGKQSWSYTDFYNGALDADNNGRVPNANTRKAIRHEPTSVWTTAYKKFESLITKPTTEGGESNEIKEANVIA